LTVGVITKPFEFEGQRRMKQAESGIEELQAYVDTLIIIPNQNLFRLANERTTFADAFHIADTVLHQGVCGVTDLMIKPGLINLDFADIRAVMGEMGKAMMGTGEASGESRATQAAEAAINNPLLDDTTMKGAHAVLINITGGMDMTLFEVDEAANRIRKEVDADATIIFGSAFDDKLEGVMRVSVVATGIDSATQALGKPSATSTPAAVTNPRHSTIVPNPLAGLVPGQPAIAKTTMADNSAPEAAALSPDVATKADAVDSPAVSNADEDVTTVNSNRDNTAEHSDLSDNAGQLDIDDAIAKSAVADVPDKKSSQQDDSSVTTDTDHTAPLAAQTDNDTEAADTVATPRVGFIPAQTTALPDAETVPVAMETPAKRPASLINKISGLWSTKPEAAEPASRKEPAIGEAQPSASILDLPRSDVVNSDVNDTDKAKLEVSDDELDIPAFLRRQAN